MISAPVVIGASHFGNLDFHFGVDSFGTQTLRGKYTGAKYWHQVFCC